MTIAATTPRTITLAAHLADTAVGTGAPGRWVLRTGGGLDVCELTAGTSGASVNHAGAVKTLCTPTLAGVAISAQASLPVTPPPPSARTALMGDSLTTHLLGYNWSPFFWINGLAAKGAQQLLANSGVSGDTVSQMNARVNNSYTNANPGLAGLSPLGLIYLRAGTNDARNSTPIASLAAGYTALLNTVKSYCTRVIILSVPPIGSTEGSFAAKNALTLEYNTWLAAFAAANPSGFTFINDSANLRDGGGAQLAGYFNPDGIHNEGRATWKEGIDAATALSSLFAGYGYTSPLSTDSADVHPTQPQYVSNHTMTGTAGNVGTGFTGQVATGWSVERNGGGITGTVAKVAADVGDPNQAAWQRVSPTQVTRTGAGESIRISTALVGPGVTSSSPDSLDMMVELRFNAFDTRYFSVARAWIQGGIDQVTHDLDLKMGGEIITHPSEVVRHQMPRRTMTTQASLTLIWDWLISANNTGSMGSFDFRCFTVRA